VLTHQLLPFLSMSPSPVIITLGAGRWPDRARVQGVLSSAGVRNTQHLLLCAWWPRSSSSTQMARLHLLHISLCWLLLVAAV
jgi:hypothetical protein